MKRIICVLLAVMLAVMCTSCTESEEIKKDPNEFLVVTSFYPVYVAALNITEGAENVRVINLTKTDIGCMHDYMLTIDDMKVLNAADLFIVSGMGMEAFMKKSSLGIPGLELLDCGEDISRQLGDEMSPNPHYWMNINNAIEQCEKIKRTLCRLDAANTEVYEKNAALYTEKLRALIPEASQAVAELSRKDMVLFHESFDYFADQFGLNIVSVLSNYDGSMPSAKTVSETINYIKGNDIKAVFAEKGSTDDEALVTVKEETGCEIYVLDTLTVGEKDDNVRDAYINAVKANLKTLKKALR